jgi:2-hydroxycyclohexanecarboxyl-CoA dehydrogenase
MDRLKDKVALVTGGGAGIGASTGSIFCSEGAAVVLVDQDGDALQAAARSIREKIKGARLDCFAADVADPGEAVKAVAHAKSCFGRLDLLVNNAAMRNYAAMADATQAEWRAMLDVNLIGAANYARAALPELRRSGAGSIVNVSSCYAVTGRKGMGIYDASKAALLAFTRTLACEEAAYGVRANAVCPGSTLTDFHLKRAKAAGKSEAEIKGARSDNSLIGRWASPEEVAWPILWLSSGEASFITGATLMVDGGLSII